MEYTCQVCKTSFSLSDDLLHHFVTAHMPGNTAQGTRSNFTCSFPQCGRTFINSECLAKHVSKEGHSGTGPPVQSAAPSYPDSYPPPQRSPVRRRAARVAIPCAQCKSFFPSQHQLNEHCRAEHPPPQMRSVSCQENGGKQCKDCGKWLASNFTLARHMQIHLGIKFPCQLCGKILTQKHAWASHMRRDHPVESGQLEEYE